MNYWEGFMSWGLDTDWVCETCENWAGLTWGIVHGVCRCNQCHTQYSMRDNSQEDRPIVTLPISRLKNEYKEPLRQAWQELHIPIDLLTDGQLDQYMKIKEVK